MSGRPRRYMVLGRSSRRTHCCTMRLSLIAVLCACVLVVAGDVSHLKAKARLLGRLAKHHKRGVLSSVPTYKLGHDIPRVTHSVVKPLVVNYPPTATVTSVKVPLSHPLIQRNPHHSSHHHFGLKFPHHHPNTVVVPKPDQHFHHHHHHVSPRPLVPVLPTVPVPATPLVPLPQSAGTVTHPIPVPSPSVVVQPTPIFPAPAPIAPRPIHLLRPAQTHLSPVLPATVPIPPAPIAPAPLAPVYPYAPQYVIRPGNAVQTSYFATYPRYPLVNYPIFPFTAPPAPSPVFLNRPSPHLHLLGPQFVQQPTPAVAVEPTTLLHPTQLPQPAFNLQPGHPAVHLHSEHGLHLPSAAHDVHLQPQNGVHFQPAGNEVHLQPTDQGVHLHQAEQGVHLHQTDHGIHFQQSDHGVHLHQADHGVNFQQPDHGVHLHQADHGFHLQQLDQAVHLHQADQGVRLHQFDQGIHYQQVDQGLFHQAEHGHLHPTQSVPLDNNGWSPIPTQPQDFPTHTQAHFHQGHDGQHFIQEQGNHVFEQHSDGQYNDLHHLHHNIQQQIDQAQIEQKQEYGAPSLGQDEQFQDYSQHQQQEYQQQQYRQAQENQNQQYHQEQEYQHQQEYQQQQLGQEYGLPQQQVEGRSGDGESDNSDSQLYHNHIPLGLQPPIDRPLENFR